MGPMETLLAVVVFLLVVGAVLYIVKFLPIDAIIKQIIYVLVFLFAVIYLFRMLGLYDGSPFFR